MLCTRLANARFLTMDPDHPVAHEVRGWGSARSSSPTS